MKNKTTPATTTTAARTAPRLHSIESTGKKQFGVYLRPVATTHAATAQPEDAAPAKRGSAFARQLDRAATGQVRSHHSPHKQPTRPFWERTYPSYQGHELAPYTGRPGAMDAQALPSRMGNRLHYRDGRVETMAA